MKVYRSELKQYISYYDYVQLSKALSRVMKKDGYQQDKRGYFIRSLYFDTIGKKDYEEKIIGYENRKKIRLRIYDTNTQKVKLEIKNKYGDYMLKETATISRQEALDLIDGRIDWLHNKDNDTLRQVYFYFKQDLYRPIIIIDYYREAYYLDFNNIRITFDKKVSSSKDFHKFFEPDTNNVVFTNPNEVILEIKFNHDLPYWVKRILSPYSPDKLSISKYCLGIDKLQRNYDGEGSYGF